VFSNGEGLERTRESVDRRLRDPAFKARVRRIIRAGRELFERLAR
jgi:hypothetical protein